MPHNNGEGRTGQTNLNVAHTDRRPAIVLSDGVGVENEFQAWVGETPMRIFESSIVILRYPEESGPNDDRRRFFRVLQNDASVNQRRHACTVLMRGCDTAVPAVRAAHESSCSGKPGQF